MMTTAINRGKSVAPVDAEHDYARMNNMEGSPQRYSYSSDTSSSCSDESSDIAIKFKAPETNEFSRELVKQIEADHERYPPRRRDPEKNPATEESLEYFRMCLQLKKDKYSHLKGLKVPPSLQSMPFALRFQSFISQYWPGSFKCCRTSFETSPSFSGHFYKKHATPDSGPLDFSLMVSTIVDDYDSDVVPLKSEFQKETDQETANGKRKRKSLSPLSSRTAFKAQKHKRLSAPSHAGHDIGRLNSELANASMALMDSSVESGPEDKAGSGVRPKRSCKPRPPFPNEVEDGVMLEIEKDQMNYPPQHQPGHDENFPADEKRIKYFDEVLAIKLNKYGQMNALRQRANGSVNLPFALTISGFTQYYWPGRVICCGLERKTITELERHITRSHRPPKPKPNFSAVPATRFNASDVDEAIVLGDNKKGEAKLPMGFNEDQNRFPPQHKPGDPEDFRANTESIDYFLDALKLKQDKYKNLEVKSRDNPLSHSMASFVSHYWPGVLNCCGKVYVTSKSFYAHISQSHSPSKKHNFPRPVIVPEDEPLVADDNDPSPVPSASVNVTPTSTSTSPAPQTGRRSGRSTRANTSSSRTPATSSGPSSNGLQVSDFQCVNEESRQLRQSVGEAVTIMDVLLVLDRILELTRSLLERWINVSSSDMELGVTRNYYIEILESILGIFKLGVVRWDELKGATKDVSLKTVKYVCGTLPFFLNWNDSKQLDDLDSVLVACANLVKHWPVLPSNAVTSKTRQEKHTKSSARRQLQQKPSVVDGASPLSSPVSVAPSAEATNEYNEQLAEFCRLANIAVSQNTKNRADSGFRDDEGQTHPMYRYGIAQILKLYCPNGVTHLKCCGKPYDLAALRVHVMDKHEKFHTDTSIAPISSE